MTTPTDHWQQIIWREWRHSPDPDYTHQLFDLVADEPVGWLPRLSSILLNTISGAALAIVCGAVLTFSWEILQYFAWAGAFIGGMAGYIFNQKMTWRIWLDRLAANTPTGTFSRVIVGSLFLGLMGGLIFGPVFWLLAVGLFWGFGDVVVWMKRGAATSLQQDLEDRYWWFWWRGRPHPFEIEAALQQASAISPAAQAVWRNPLGQLAANQALPSSPETLISTLLSENWVERFVARHRLVRLGKKAVPVLQQALAKDEDNTPLQQTLLWLIQSIQRGMTPPALNVPETEKTQAS
jgi:hypothetical protein